MEQRVIVASRWWILFHVAAAALATAGGVWMLVDFPQVFDEGGVSSRQGMDALLLAIGGGIGMAASLIRLARPTRLTLSPEGLVVERAFGGRRRIFWRDVEAFYVSQQAPDWRNAVSPIASPRGGAVSVRYAARSGLFSLADGSNSGFGRDELLPVADFGMSGEALAAVLNDYRARAAALAAAVP